MLANSEVARLVESTKRGEIQAFSSLVSAHLRAAYMTALAVVGSPEDAEDVVQEAFLVAFERLETCREPARFSGWLLRIVRNRALNALSAQRIRNGAGTVDDVSRCGHSEEPTDSGLRGCLLEALTHITEVQREIVLLHDLEGWTHAEIADALNLSTVMCRQHLFNARNALRARLAQVTEREVKNGK